MEGLHLGLLLNALGALWTYQNTIPKKEGIRWITQRMRLLIRSPSLIGNPSTAKRGHDSAPRSLDHCYQQNGGRGCTCSIFLWAVFLPYSRHSCSLSTCSSRPNWIIRSVAALFPPHSWPFLEQPSCSDKRHTHLSLKRLLHVAQIKNVRDSTRHIVVF